jgi:hypothetical protein
VVVNRGELRVIVTLPSGEGAVLYFSPIRLSGSPETLAHPPHPTPLCLAAIIAELQAAGVTSLRGIAAALNERGTATPRRGGVRKAGTVARLLTRLPP